MAERTLHGTGATPRSGVGTVVWYGRDISIPEPDDIEVEPEAEAQRFADAVDAARDELESEREATTERVGEDEAAVFDAHIQFLEDPTIEEAVKTAVNEGHPAPTAVDAAFGQHIERFEGMDGRMAERADDLRDVRDRLLRLLTDGERVDFSDLPDGSVVIAERLTPSDTAQLDPERVAGFATVTGGRTSHASIFARSLALPAVVGVGEDLTTVDSGAEVVIDGDDGTILVGPDDTERAAAAGGSGAAIVDETVTTTDGRHIEVAANIGQPAELEPAAERGADGVGLYRTEFLFLDREGPPSEDEQYEAIREALDAFPDGRVVVRTLDIGGDKRIPYLDLPDEENPFLGERGIRRSLDPDSDLFATQLRALLRAAADGAGDLAIMFPLVATVKELDAALDALDAAAADVEDCSADAVDIEVGVMIETPSAAFMADELAARVDFLSIGTNDLTQYVMAADRENERVGDLHDPTHPGVLRAIHRTVRAAHAEDAWVGLCGEMAGDPELTELLVGLGLDELSMSAVTIPEVKTAVSETEYSAASERADHARLAATRSEVHTTLDT
ncbi:phosphotransferase system, enzyme I, PtsI [Haloarcula vallismortis]|uniref:Phosphoenolpyruvate-protein phosphotransferase n=2 Tax=Haloarcula vallismortis TaxID=28442 RepID=M0JMC1_HALVA|nr:phosphoenolpyruvate--protein phosphotransferase [Haloarcula vallismortis]EMA08830.1 phosphoenolpyruvate-protein phosphotransferase [Haloarcula vallismortis ATCC 29715]SDX23052.1 phosphotransferase system, enzyme I, PtsI [Haloarcula vallismortis]